MMLSETERIKILIIVGYGDRQRSHREAANLFNDMHPDRNPIPHTTVTRIVRKFAETGSIKDLPRSGRPKSATDGNTSLDVLLRVQENPKVSTTNLALECDISQSSVMKILKSAKQHPYKIQLLHELSEDDPDRRMQFCELMMERINNNPGFIKQIVFTDEATFCLNGFVNRHNCRYWSDVNPQWMEENHTQYPQKLNVWAGIIGDHIIGPFFLRETLNANRYLDLLQNQIVPAIANLFPHQINHRLPNDDIYFQQDGAPAHYGQNVRGYLDQIFPQRWIGRRGHIEWPARSPDLSPLDFFLWGHLKSVVYRERPNNLHDLEHRIMEAVQDIPKAWLNRSLNGFYDRLAHCQAAEGYQFEHRI